MFLGHDGAGENDEFGPDSDWAYWNDNPEDDEAFADLIEDDENPWNR
jgi:hypothetical protein